MSSTVTFVTFSIHPEDLRWIPGKAVEYFLFKLLISFSLAFSIRRISMVAFFHTHSTSIKVCHVSS